MADKRITQLNELQSPTDSDLFAVVDVSEKETKKVSYSNLKSSLGETLVPSSYISCYSTQSQQLTTSGSAQPVTFTDVWTNDGVNLVSGSQLVMEKKGTYKFSFVAHITNPDNDTHDSFFWVKYNGNNFPNSTVAMTLNPRKNSGGPSSQLMTMNIVGVAQNDNDYIELYWTGDSNTIELTEVPQNGIKPESPSVIANIVRVG